MTESICVVCGKKFDAYRKAKYCSSKCYRSIPEVKERRKEYQKEYYSRPEVKKKQKKQKKEYYSRPEVKKKHNEHTKEYYSRPEVKKKHNEHMKEYYSRPEVKKKHNEYMKEYHLTRVCPSRAVNDFFKYVYRNRFNSVEDFRQTALNYTKATCSIEGNCKIQKRIVEDERFELCCDLIEKRLSGAKK